MRLRNILLCLVVIFSVVTISVSAQENETEIKYWYQVGVSAGNQIIDYLGSSNLSETQFIGLLNGSEPLLLEDLIAFGPTGTIKKLTEEQFWQKGKVYINPKFIVYVLPAKGDPREIRR